MIRKNIPNFVTILNLLSGCISIVFAFNGNLALASWLIGLAAIFDFLDGFLARLLNARSPIGLQLDSLSDVISFGVAPGVIIFQLMQNSEHLPFFYWDGVNIASFAAFIVPVFSALRLAKFNIDDRQTDSFIGLPTPANALFFASLPLVQFQAENLNHHWINIFLQNYPLLLTITLIFSFLLVSQIPLMGFKFKTFRFSDNKLRYVFLVFSAALILALKFYASPVIVLIYILLSIFDKRNNMKVI